MNIRNIMWPGLVVLGLFGCANAQPTSALVDARREYEAAAGGPANSFVPDRVYEARVALEKAEQAHQKNPGSEKEAHLAYIAHRKALIAEAVAQERIAKHELARAQAQQQQVLVAQRNSARTRLEQQTQQLSEATGKLESERELRMQAQDEARAAMQSLEELGQVKAEQQRITLTISGEVLFRTAESDLMPIARQRLERVAEVLKQEGVDKTIEVKGYTDSRGTEAYNQRLSEDRARSVRDFLVEEGVPADQVKSVGMGENHPIATNATPSGQANNRRVEIVIDYENSDSGSGSMKSPGSGSQQGSQQR